MYSSALSDELQEPCIGIHEVVGKGASITVPNFAAVNSFSNVVDTAQKPPSSKQTGSCETSIRSVASLPPIQNSEDLSAYGTG